MGVGVAELEKVSAKIKQNNNGEVVEVDLDNTQVTDAGLIHLKELTNLEMLSLYYSQVTDEGLVHLTGLANLNYLNLTETKITDKGLVHLKGMTNLQELYLSRILITTAVMRMSWKKLFFFRDAP